MKYTKAPWKVDKEGIFIDHREDAEWICKFGEGYNWPDDESERFANAHLIAAAPELYEACKLAWNYLFGEPSATKILYYLKTAIEKAESN